MASFWSYIDAQSEGSSTLIAKVAFLARLNNWMQSSKLQGLWGETYFLNSSTFKKSHPYSRLLSDRKCCSVQYVQQFRAKLPSLFSLKGTLGETDFKLRTWYLSSQEMKKLFSGKYPPLENTSLQSCQKYPFTASCPVSPLRQGSGECVDKRFITRN